MAPTIASFIFIYKIIDVKISKPSLAMCTSRGISIFFFKRFFQKSFTLLAAVLLFVTQQVLAQVADDFADGDPKEEEGVGGDAFLGEVFVDLLPTFVVLG